MIIKRITRFNRKTLMNLNALLLQLTPRKYQMNVGHLKKIVGNKSIHMLGLYDNDIIVGTATLISLHQITGNKGYVEDVVVDEKYRGRGLAKKLMLQIIALAKKLNIFRLELKSEIFRAEGNNLYQKLGFEKIEASVYQLKL